MNMTTKDSAFDSVQIDAVPTTSTQKLSVLGNDKDHIHLFQLVISGAGTRSWTLPDLLGGWKRRKGNITFKSMKVKYTFDDANGRVLFGMLAPDTKISSFGSMMNNENIKEAHSGPMDPYKSDTMDITIPEGLDDSIWPMWGPLPKPDFVIYSDKAVKCFVTIQLVVTISGPPIYRWALQWVGTKILDESHADFAKEEVSVVPKASSSK